MRAYAWATVSVLAATALGVLGRGLLSAPDVVMLYLFVIMIVAIRFGRGPSLAAGVLSVAAYDFFCVPPFYTFAVAHPSHVLTFAMMLLVGLLVSGLTARIRAQEQEVRQRELRARAEEMRSSLLSAVSHDLRTPLAAITGAATALRDGMATAGAPPRDELVSTICEEAERLERLVGNLLDMTRLESGSMVVKREWVPLEEIVGAALVRMESRLEGRVVATKLAADLPLLSVDPLLLEQTFVNLLENAAKYTPPGTPIQIAAHANGEIEIDVMDRGPGLPAGAEQRIFQRFVRGPHAAQAGVGLGLAICRGIVEAHGGRISAKNRPGGGSSFSIVLPLAVGEPAPPPHAELENATEAP
jgi:K+-sensing histidine kinase KdpD